MGLLTWLMASLKRLIANEEGQGVIEYTLMVGMVVLAIWAAVFVFDIPGAVQGLWQDVSTALNDPTANPS